MTKRVLVIDDDINVGIVLSMTLENVGYEVVSVTSGMEGLKSIDHNHFDLILLDVTMPVMNGWQTCRLLREISDVPIIMLTVRGREREIVRGLRLGADDYIVKPWSNRELLARIKAVLRRASIFSTTHWQGIYACGDLTIDLIHRQVILGDERIEVTPIEFRLLAYLSRHPGQIVPYSELIAQLWGIEYKQHIICLRVHVHNLRQKIEKDPRHPQYLLGKHRIGYYLSQGEAR